MRTCNSGIANATAELDGAPAAMEREFYDWWNDNAHMLIAGFSVDFNYLRLRLNAAVANSFKSSEDTASSERNSSPAIATASM
jgi:hypothetical protein